MTQKNINHKKVGKHYILSCFVVLLFLNVSLTNSLIAQSDSLSDPTTTSTPSEASLTDTSGGPSLTNLSKNNTAIREKMLEEARWNTIISYIQMIVGFIITVTLAWLLASWARKQEKKRDEAKRIRVEKALLRKGFTIEEIQAGKKAPVAEKNTGTNPPPVTRRPPPKRRR